MITILFCQYQFLSTTHAITDHVVVSEVQISGGNADDEFIEIYNPTENDIDLSGWSIQRSSVGGSFAKKNFVDGNTILSHGYFLIANNDYDGGVLADMYHNSFTLSSTGTTVFLVSDQILLETGEEVSIVDKLAIGENSLFYETSPYLSIPASHESVERKPGNIDPLAGNGVDTDNNSEDFISRNLSDPQNTLSNLEPEDPIVTPTLTLTPTPTPTSTTVPTNTPTSTPTPSPNPTQTPGAGTALKLLYHESIRENYNKTRKSLRNKKQNKFVIFKNIDFVRKDFCVNKYSYSLFFNPEAYLHRCR